MPPSDFDLPTSISLLANRLLIAVATMVILTAIERPAAAQDYPWCANFADGAGTNCGFSTQAQCMTTVAGSGGYCSENNLYKPANDKRTTASVRARHFAKRPAASRAIKN